MEPERPDTMHPSSECCLSARDVLLAAGKAIIVLFAIQGVAASLREMRDAVGARQRVKALDRRWQRFSQEEENALRQI
ncbi:MAG: hypothetical protein IT210_10710 [Armatimonadetes bacterium]|nr:hypothetical protein [Armatimonadota bacterium]